jgi:hypothetical protein
MSKTYKITAEIEGELYIVVIADSEEEAAKLAKDSSNWIYDDVDIDGIGEILSIEEDKPIAEEVQP